MKSDNLYSALKMTREEKDNAPMKDKEFIAKINSTITIEDVQKMPASEIKEVVIDYLSVIVPGFKYK